MAVLNAHILYKKSSKIISTLNFILKLVDRVIQTYSQEKIQIRKGRQFFSDTPLHLTARQFPENIPSTPSKKPRETMSHLCG